MQKKWRQYWLFQLIGWGSFALINIFFAFSFNKLIPDYFWRLGVFIVVGVIVSHIMREIITRLGILQKSLNKQVLQFFVLTFSLALIASFIYIEILIGFKLLKAEDQQLLKGGGVNVFDQHAADHTFQRLFLFYSLLYLEPYLFHVSLCYQEQETTTRHVAAGGPGQRT
jgi:hypothetical protein